MHVFQFPSNFLLAFISFHFFLPETMKGGMLCTPLCQSHPEKVNIIDYNFTLISTLKESWHFHKTQTNAPY